MKLTVPNFSTNSRESSSHVSIPAQTEGVKPHTDLNRLSKDTFQHSGTFTQILSEQISHVKPAEELVPFRTREEIEEQHDKINRAYKELRNPQTTYDRIQSLKRECGGFFTDLQKGLINQFRTDIMGEAPLFEIKDPRFQVQAKEK
jgi:hypothetical protein